MAHHKSAKKRILTNEKARLRNVTAKSRVRTLVKAAHADIQEGNAKVNEGSVQAAVKAIAKQAAKGRYHKKTAARKISRLMKAANS